MTHINAIMRVILTLEDGSEGEFYLDNCTIELEKIDDGPPIVVVYDNHGDQISSTEDGSSHLAFVAGRWLKDLGIKDDEWRAV